MNASMDKITKTKVDPERIESEDKSGDDLREKPWDPQHIRITTKNFTVRELYSQIKGNELDLAPDFQRSFVWKSRQQIRLIETILLGIPLPVFYFNQDNVGAHQVIDGVQRLTTFKHFMSDNLVLEEQHLEYLKALKGLRYTTLDPGTRRRFQLTQIVAHVIEPQTPDEVKYDIFNRVNTGGSPLTAQEIRHCMSKPRSRAFLKALVESPSFDKAMGNVFRTKDAGGNWMRDNLRMSDREMALRFCAFRSVSLAEYASASSLDAFLLEFTRRIDQASPLNESSPDLDDLETAFNRAMENCAVILDKGAFRLWPPTKDSPASRINRAIFESQALALANSTLETLMPHREAIVAKFRALFENDKYENAVRSGTGDVRKVKLRLTMPRKVIEEILG